MIDRSKYLIFFHDDENLRKFYENRKDPHIKIGFSYGMNGGDLKIKEIHESLNNIKFSFMLENIEYNGEINLHGSFNVLNVCATILLIHKAFNISVEEILIHLPKLKHSKRRMEIIYEDTERIIFDDQALTPKEISVVLSSVKKYKKPIYILLDPFRDIRVNYFFNEFCEVIKPYIFASTYEQFWHLPNCIPIKTNDDFKEFLNSSNLVEYAEGHANAFGIRLREENLIKLIDYCNTKLPNTLSVNKFLVDYVFDIKKYKVNYIFLCNK